MFGPPRVWVPSWHRRDVVMEDRGFFCRVLLGQKLQDGRYPRKTQTRWRDGWVGRRAWVILTLGPSSHLVSLCGVCVCACGLMALISTSRADFKGKSLEFVPHFGILGPSRTFCITSIITVHKVTMFTHLYVNIYWIHYSNSSGRLVTNFCGLLLCRRSETRVALWHQQNDTTPLLSQSHKISQTIKRRLKVTLHNLVEGRECSCRRGSRDRFGSSSFPRLLPSLTTSILLSFLASTDLRTHNHSKTDDFQLTVKVTLLHEYFYLRFLRSTQDFYLSYEYSSHWYGAL